MPSDDAADRPVADLVHDKFRQLIAALEAAALAGHFERAAAYRSKVLDLADRWRAGQPAHQARAGKGKAA